MSMINDYPLISRFQLKSKSAIAASILLGCLVVSCAVPPDAKKAEAVAEKCLQAIDHADYKSVIEDCYSTDPGSRQSLESVTEKFNKLRVITGKMISFKLKSSESKSEVGEESMVILTYIVNRERVNTTEKFFVQEQGSDYRIVLQDVEN